MPTRVLITALVVSAICLAGCAEAGPADRLDALSPSVSPLDREAIASIFEGLPESILGLEKDAVDDDRGDGGVRVWYTDPGRESWGVVGAVTMRFPFRADGEPITPSEFVNAFVVDNAEFEESARNTDTDDIVWWLGTQTEGSPLATTYVAFFGPAHGEWLFSVESPSEEARDNLLGALLDSFSR